MNKKNFKIWKRGVEDAMRIVGEHIRCPLVEDKVRTEIEIQATVAEQQERKDGTVAEQIEKIFEKNDFGWQEPIIHGTATKKDIGWQSRFKKHFGNGPVNRRARK